MAPLGTQTIIYEPKAQRKSIFASHGILGWYISPAPDHYRNYKIYVPASTRGTRSGKTIQFVPCTFPMPAISSAGKASYLVEDLIHEIKNPAPANVFHNVGTSGTTTICTLETFFTTKPPSNPPLKVAILKPATALPRVQPRTKQRKNVHFPTPAVFKCFANQFSLPNKPLFRNPATDSTNIIPSTAVKRTLWSNYTARFVHALSAILTTEATTTAHTNSRHPVQPPEWACSPRTPMPCCHPPCYGKTTRVIIIISI